MKKYKAFIAPTTHWDREWIMTQGQYQVRLVNLMDNVLKIMEENPDYRFMLDGQVIALEDYLKVCPEQREKVIGFLKTRQLIVGPWYVLADQFLQNGESAIRNLLYGIRQTKVLGGQPMMVGYVPDSFGSIASLPMLLSGFNIPYAIFGRGRPEWGPGLPHSEFRWDAPDGSRVLAANHGYWNGVFLSYPDIWTDVKVMPDPDPEETLARFMDHAKEQLRSAATHNLYFSVGVDHMEAKPSLPGLIEYIGKHQEEFELVYGTPEDYLRAVEQSMTELYSYQGEMRGPKDNKMDLVGTLSSRMYLKQWNDLCEILLQRVLEPLWSVTSALTGAKYPYGLIHNLWKLLLANHPHDSICGCSLDQVHKDMVNRYEYIQISGEYLVKDGMQTILSHVSTMGPAADAVAVIVVNPLGRNVKRPVKGFLRVPKRFKYPGYTLVNELGVEIPACIKHITDKKKDLESTYMTNHQLAALPSKTASPDLADDHVFTILEIEFIAEGVPAFGYKTWWLKPAVGEKAFKPGVWLCNGGMENRYMKVQFNDNGTFNLCDKVSGHTFKGLNYLVDREDAGNLYDYHGFSSKPEEEDSRKYTAQWEAVEVYSHRITFRTTIFWTLPAHIEEEKRSLQHKAMPVTIYATLYADIGRLEITVEFENVCKDHCLRVAFDTGLPADTVSAYDHFHVIEREVNPVSKEEWRDHPFQDFIDISDGTNGFCLMTRGLPAYEAVKTDEGTRLYLTLLRSVGRISTDNVGAGYLTPEGQCPGKHRFEYAIALHAGNWMTGNCIGSAVDYKTPYLTEADLQHTGKIPSKASFIELHIDGNSYPQVTCLKKAEDGPGFILRLWNPYDEQDIVLETYPGCSRIGHVSLNEEKIREISQGRGHLPAKGLTTIHIE